jgi:hypothetical protein
MKKVKMQLVGLDGNIFNVLGQFSKNASRRGWSKEEIDEVQEKVFTSDSYDQALSYIIENVEEIDEN